MSFNSYPSADCSLIGDWGLGIGHGALEFFPPTLLCSSASQYYLKTLPIQHFFLINVSVGEDDNIPKNE
ncbi:MAG: hypothetical protein V7K98_10415 [Nostoc sp.]|uniref:hypothetical protein n=1 Tax=Nostoc sp. TaxID=1180 RepID=UPI002FFA86D3